MYNDMYHTDHSYGLFGEHADIVEEGGDDAEVVGGMAGHVPPSLTEQSIGVQKLNLELMVHFCVCQIARHAMLKVMTRTVSASSHIWTGKEAPFA